MDPKNDESELFVQIALSDRATLLHNLLEKIRSGDFEGGKKIAIIISAARDVKIDNLKNDDIITSIKRNIQPRSKIFWNWAEFLDSELARKETELLPLLHEILSEIVKNKRSDWNVFEFPSVVVAMLDLGLDLFVPESKFPQAIPNMIIYSDKLTMENRIKVIQILLERSQSKRRKDDNCTGLLLDGFKTDKWSKILPYLEKLVDFERIKLNGLWFIHCILKFRHVDWLNHIESEKLKRMLLQRNAKGKSALLILLPKVNFFSPHLISIIEIMMKENFVADAALRDITDRMVICGSEWVHQCTKRPILAKSHHYHKAAKRADQKFEEDNGSVNEITIFGNTEFPFYHLPAEVAMMICKDLDAVTILNIFLTCKSVHERRDLREIVAPGEKQLHDDFPLIYSTMNTKSPSAFQMQYAKHYGLSSNWKKGRFSVKRIEMTVEGECDPDYLYPSKFNMLDMDENWLLLNGDNQIKLWNCHTQTMQSVDTKISEAEFVSGYKIIESNDSGITPTFGYFLDREFVIHRNNQKHAYSFRVNFPKAYRGDFMENIGNNTILTSNKAYYFDYEVGVSLGRVQPVELAENTFVMTSAAYNPYNNMIALAAMQSQVFIADRNTHFVVSRIQKVPAVQYPYRDSQFDVKFIDEHLLAHSSEHYLTVVDTRMMKELFSLRTHQRIRGVNKHGRTTVQSPKSDLAVIWNLKTLRWEHVINLPPKCETSPLMNSRFAVFRQKNCRDSFVCLDFGETN